MLLFFKKTENDSTIINGDYNDDRMMMMATFWHVFVMHLDCTMLLT